MSDFLLAWVLPVLGLMVCAVAVMFCGMTGRWVRCALAVVGAGVCALLVGGAW